ncbi:hypothetical protein HMPREF1042_0959 [Streptococcus constellatus subsp. pharyngis SK1060 = CCUG 46377]|uniref:Uncharacterized protein n=1 Tax=Streptococcus constellatus subsp. pharyngis SK1060 = CCUG 46377 TaxID=1035184 RepID=F9P664_STRCV|nr:hypothetical protein HMPREF1042_0959 [Streptococcus constellatus subsp. pharyngis SK1060 = CCUG 46377]
MPYFYLSKLGFYNHILTNPKKLSKFMLAEFHKEKSANRAGKLI